MNRHVIIRIIVTTLKVLVALAAVGNLVALFVFQYQTPSWLRRGEPAAVEELEPAEPVSDDGAPEESETVLSVNEGPNGEHLSIPVIPFNYSGEEELDILALDGVYLLGGDGQQIKGADIQYEILPGESRLEKIVRYSVELESGDVLTVERAMKLTSRYTGPIIALLGNLPGIDPSKADSFVERLGNLGVISADDGFGNDMTYDVVAEFDGLSDEEPDAGMTLHLENQIHDTFDMELTVHVLDYSGIVLVLTDYNITLTEGDDFEPMDYVKYAHDVDGSDMMDRVQLSNHVDPYTPGEYYVCYWVWNDEHTAHSPDRYMYVTVEALPEETEETEETEEAP